MRPTWDEYFMEIAEVVKKRSTCIRRQVGAVIVKDGKIIARGYNKKETRKDSTEHAEINAIKKACKKLTDFFKSFKSIKLAAFVSKEEQ